MKKLLTTSRSMASKAWAGHRPKPRYQVVREEIRQQIYDGQLAKGQRIPTEAELATQYDVSNITIRRAMQELVGEGLLVRSAGLGTFVNPSRFTATYNFLFVHRQDYSFDYPYTGLIFKGICDANVPTIRFRLETLGLRPRYEQTHEGDQIKELIHHDHIHGVLAMPFLRTATLIELMDMVPLVHLGWLPEPTAPHRQPAVVSYALPGQALDLALEHLVRTGRRKAACVLGPDSQPDEAMLAPIFARHGLPFDLSMVEMGAWGMNGGAAATAKLLARHKDLDAIVTSDDFQAVGVMQALWQRRLEPGKQVAVVGQGNLLDEHSHLGLTTIELHIKHGARRAAELLLDMVNQRPVSPIIELPPKLILRQTA